MPQRESTEEFVTRPPAGSSDAFWLKKGTFKTSPTSHASCFTCHSMDSGIAPLPSDCAACHKLGTETVKADFDAKLAAAMKIDDKTLLISWRRRDSSGTFRHEFMSHSELSCATCHNVKTMDTTRSGTKRVSISSCSMCHVTASVAEGGALNAEIEARRSNANFQCTKCHVIFGNRAIPESHLKALEGGY
jgi:hypothetical protein